MKRNSKILICYNEPYSFYNNYTGKDISENVNVDLSETEFKNNLDTISTLLSNHFNVVETFGFTSDINKAINKLETFSPDLVFNFVESIEGNSKYEIYATGLFELFGIKYTGNNPLCLANCLFKERTKQLLKFKNIKTPNFFIINKNTKLSETEFCLKYPVILKLASEDASIGISENSVVNNFKELKKQVNYLRKNFGIDILAEEFIKGRELNIAILSDKFLPISEISFAGLPDEYPAIVTYEAKWSPDSIYFKYSNPICPANLEPDIQAEIYNVAYNAYSSLGCRDYARVDIRLSEKNIPYVIEVNPNPDISPDTGFVRSANAAGINYESLLLKISECAFNRK
jgi:D-alanine-D-alanine ligase